MKVPRIIQRPSAKSIRPHRKEIAFQVRKHLMAAALKTLLELIHADAANATHESVGPVFAGQDLIELMDLTEYCASAIHMAAWPLTRDMTTHCALLKFDKDAYDLSQLLSDQRLFKIENAA